jgi:hypothetical protein
MIGYVCGGLPVIAKMPLQVVIRRGASDACLAPYHVFRSKAVVIERFAGHPFIDGGAHCARHRADPLSDTGGNDHAETDTEAGLLRAADLIGPRSNVSTQDQCAFLRVRRDGVNGKLGYSSPADLAQRYPVSFGPRLNRIFRYWRTVETPPQILTSRARSSAAWIPSVTKWNVVPPSITIGSRAWCVRTNVGA